LHFLYSLLSKGNGQDKRNPMHGRKLADKLALTLEGNSNIVECTVATVSSACWAKPNHNQLHLQRIETKVI
jgi:hypothetical protein